MILCQTGQAPYITLGLQLTNIFIFSINRLVVWSTEYQKMVKMLIKAKGDILKCPQPKDIQFTATED